MTCAAPGHSLRLLLHLEIPTKSLPLPHDPHRAVGRRGGRRGEGSREEKGSHGGQSSRGLSQCGGPASWAAGTDWGLRGKEAAAAGSSWLALTDHVNVGVGQQEPVPVSGLTLGHHRVAGLHVAQDQGSMVDPVY